MPDLSSQYEKLLQQNIAKASRQIKRQYQSAIQEISVLIDTSKFKGQAFSLSQYPALKKKIDDQLAKMHTSIYSTVVNSVKTSWDFSNKKNNLIVDKRIAGRRPTDAVRKILYDPNKPALDAFIARREKGLNLSERVWNTLDPFKKELEAGLGLNISEGKSAAVAAKEMQKFLNNPDELFRRVRDAKGKLKLSKAASEFHPGQGVYRSSYKNALRLTRTENNIAYRSSDFERWNNLPFVTGIEIKLSKNHPRFDMCDYLTGEYPKEFKFTGWHPQCICYQVPKMMSDSEYNRLEDSILGIEEFDPASVERVNTTPAGFNKWVKDNRERISGWKNEPYWVRDNPDFYNSASSKSTITHSVPGGKPIAPQFTKIDTTVKAKAQRALKLIDSVHGDGNLKDIPIRPINSKDVQAQFATDAFGMPVLINISKKATNPEFSIIHEMGHFLDNYGVGKKGLFDSEGDNTPFSRVIQAAEKTDLVKDLRKLFDDGFVIKNGEREYLSVSHLNYIDYLLNPIEVWARSYAQFITNKTADKDLVAGLNNRLKIGNKTGIHSHWLDDDFKVIQEAMEDAMKEIGWIVSQ